MFPIHILLTYPRPGGARASVVAHLDAGGDPRAYDNAALCWACHRGHLDVVERLISLGLTLADARANDNYALQAACREGRLDVLERLISLGLTADDARRSALVWACLGGYHDIVARLLELGVVPTPAALVSLAALSRPDEESDSWAERLWRAVERWEGSPELQAAESGLTPPQLDMWETTKAQARPCTLSFSD